MLRKDNFLFYLVVLILVFFSDKSGILGLLLFGAITVVCFHFFLHNITYAFLICILIVINPGQFLSSTSFGLTTHFIRLGDIYFYLSFFCLLSPEVQKHSLDNNVKRLLPILIVFTFYQIFVSVILHLNKTTVFDIFKTLEERKLFIFGIFFLLPTYKILQNNFKLFFNSIIILAIIFALIYLISIYSDFKIINFYSETRYRGSMLMRNMIQNAELFKLTIYISVVYYFIAKIPYKWFILIAGILSLSIPIIGLYRLETLFTVFTIGLAALLTYNLLGFSNSKVLTLIFYLIIGGIIIHLLFPILTKGFADTLLMTLQEFQGDKATGTTQTRTIIELPKHLYLIKHNFLFGTGFRQEWFANFYNINDWGLSDIPITSTLAFYGIVGMLIYYSRFIWIFQQTKKIHNLINRGNESKIINIVPETITVISLSAYFISMISFRLFYIGWELTLSVKQVEFGIFIGMYYGLINLLSNFHATNLSKNTLI